MLKRIVFFLLPFIMAVNLSATITAEYHMDEASWNGTAGEVLDSTGSNNGTAQNGATTTTGIHGN